MKKEYANHLLNKTKEDYNLISEEFSRTRWFIWEETKFLFSDYTREGDKVLDIGCGNGRYFELLKDADYVGIDNSSKLIEEAKKKYAEANFLVADALDIPFGDNTFDKIYSIAVLHNIPSKELRLEFLNEAKRVLKSKGLLILTVWKFHRSSDYFRLFKNIILKLVGKSKLDFKDFLEPWSDRTLRYFHWFSKKELKRIVLKAGFNVKEIGVVRNKKGNRRNIYIIAEKS
jgi:ubiquinone/menaquinone biosynthesis C-methylase UbiE